MHCTVQVGVKLFRAGGPVCLFPFASPEEPGLAILALLVLLTILASYSTVRVRDGSWAIAGKIRISLLVTRPLTRPDDIGFLGLHQHHHVLARGCMLRVVISSHGLTTWPDHIIISKPNFPRCSAEALGYAE
jgi:hypothetical protein